MDAEVQRRETELRNLLGYAIRELRTVEIKHPRLGRGPDGKFILHLDLLIDERMAKDVFDSYHELERAEVFSKEPEEFPSPFATGDLFSMMFGGRSEQ